MPTLPTILSKLKRHELLTLADQLGVTIEDRRFREPIVDALARVPVDQVATVLNTYSRDTLKSLCEQLGLSDEGREKAAIVDRLLSTDEPTVRRVPLQLSLLAGAEKDRPPTKSGARMSETNVAAAAQPRTFGSFSEIAGFIWSVADLLRGDYKPADYGSVILPFTVLRRLDCVLADTKDAVLAKAESLREKDVKNLDAYLNRVTKVPFHNASKLDFAKMLGDPGHIKANILSYVKGFSTDARDVMERFNFTEQVERLEGANLLFLVVQRFADPKIDLHPRSVPNHMMGSIFEELIRKFAETSNETAGDHFTPREVIRLMVDLLFTEDAKVLTRPGAVKTIYDPACGTGGMLSVAEEYLRELNPDAQLEVFGQELNDESFAICKSDMMIKGQNPENIARGNSFTQDGHAGKRFDYMLSNPPFGVEWKKVEQAIRDEAEKQGHAGRFGAGLPRISDGSLLFLQHMISKMKPADPKTGEGSRIAIVLNGSPLFTGDAGSGESEIRRWIIENDWLEAIVGLPDQLFFNTGISTYIWVVTNHKPAHRRGKVQLINAVDLYKKMRKSLGNKRNELDRQEHIPQIARLFGEFQPGELSKIFDNEDFGYRRIVVERPLRLSFQASPERIARLQEEPGFANLAKSKKKGTEGAREAAEGVELQAAILKALSRLDAAKVYKRRDQFEDDVDGCLKLAGVKIAAPVRKAIASALGERDESAEVCLDADGKPEPDADLRDTENVPLKEDIRVYFDREVKPHVPDAWIDESKTKVGYEIPFARQFYRPLQLRDIEVVEREIRGLEKQIQVLLNEALA